jgi:NAD+ synthase (glutamine-hydrolysing)
MPSRYSSEGSISDAELLSKEMGIKLITIPIEKAFQAFLDMLSDTFKGTGPNVAEENLQARIRGSLLMAVSNKFGWLVLTTGNRSEASTGYATLYGDMAGGFAVIKDVPKTVVYELCEYRNSVAKSEFIPVSIIKKPPSAELRPGQLDADSLPVYEVLDPILTAFMDEHRSVEQIIDMGFEEQAVRRVAGLVRGSEYKRYQAPPGIVISPRTFGRKTKMPLTNRFREDL